MLIDKELYQNAYAQYQRWNAEKTARRHYEEQRQSRPAWKKYIDLVEFCWRLSPQQSIKQRTQKLAALDQYYANIQQFEKLRKANAKSA